MKLQFSAGGIVYKNQKDDALILLCQHSQHHGWVFPKGLIDDKKSASAKGFGETKEDAALREVEEETGAKGKIVKMLTPVTYWFVFDSPAGEERVKKTVYYFLMEYVGGDIEKHDQEMETVEWLPVEKVEERLTYKSDKKVWQEAKELIVNGK